MPLTDSQIIDAVLIREGGLVNDPKDRGGVTKFGVTAHALADYRGSVVTDDDIRQLSLTEARQLYMDSYVHKPGFHLLESDALRGALVDWAVNSGAGNATQGLQRALKLTPDGIVGAETLHTANIADGPSLAMRVCWERARFLGRLVGKDPSQAKFISGWLNRVADLAESLV